MTNTRNSDNKGDIKDLITPTPAAAASTNIVIQTSIEAREAARAEPKTSSTATSSDEIQMPAPLLDLIAEYEHEHKKEGIKTGVQGNALLVSTLFNTIKTRTLAPRVRDLLTAIVSGEPDKVTAILDNDPSLLYEKLEGEQFVTAPSGHKFNVKPYQAALSVDDTQMAKLIKPYFVKLGDEKEADTQFDEQYPKGWEETEKKKWQASFEQLNKLTLAIRDSKPGDIISLSGLEYIVTVRQGSPVERELHIFWALLDSTLDEVIIAGKKPFNSNLLLEAWQTYDNDKLYKEYFGGCWNNPRALLFWQKVIGYEGIQRFMPLNYVQAFHGWLENTIAKLQNDKPQDRSTQFTIIGSSYSSLVSFYPLQPRGACGFIFAIYGPYGLAMTRDGGWEVSNSFSELISIKNSKLTELMPAYRCASTKSFCEIM